MNTIKKIDKGPYKIIQLYRDRANVINQDMVDELTATIESLKNDTNCRGMILTGQPNFFSAGLDLIELYDYNHEQLAHFLKSFGMLYVDMVKFPKPMVVAITGHSPAGGTVMAITADYRVMTEGEKFKLGLNEVAVNIQISKDLITGYSYWIGKGRASKYILEGKLLTGQEALDCNLVDEVVRPDQVLARAESKMKEYLRADDEILLHTKYELRREWIESLVTEPGEAFKRTLDIWWRPEIRARMKMMVDFLQSK